MSYPPIFTIAKASSAVTTLLGANPTRFWPFADAPKNEERPYAVHQLVYGTPSNLLDGAPNDDLFGIQVDCYAKTATDARNVADALRDAIEDSTNSIAAWNGEEIDTPTGLYRVSFTAEFWTDR